MSSGTALPSIHTVRSLYDVLEYVDASTVVFLDIDNTLLTVSQEQDIGSSQWEKAVTREALSCGVPAQDAWRVSCWLWQAMQNVVDMRQCEDGEVGGDGSGTTTADAVARMSAAGAIVVGLTARHPTLRARTAELLAAHGIALGSGLSTCGGSGDDASYSLGDPTKASQSETVDMRCDLVLHRGTVFCCGARKTEAAHALLSRLPEARWRTVILVDDTLSHVEALAHSFAARAEACDSGSGSGGGGGGSSKAHTTARFVGFHYTRLEDAANAPLVLDAGSRLLTRAFCSTTARADLLHAARAAQGAGAAAPPEVGELRCLPDSL